MEQTSNQNATEEKAVFPITILESDVHFLFLSEKEDSETVKVTASVKGNGETLFKAISSGLTKFTDEEFSVFESAFQYAKLTRMIESLSYSFKEKKEEPKDA